MAAGAAGSFIKAWKSVRKHRRAPSSVQAHLLQTAKTVAHRGLSGGPEVTFLIGFRWVSRCFRQCFRIFHWIFNIFKTLKAFLWPFLLGKIGDVKNWQVEYWHGSVGPGLLEDQSFHVMLAIA